MNPDVEIVETRVLSDDWYTLSKVTFRHRGPDGLWHLQSREAYDRGNGAALLLYHPANKTVILTRQFRLPTYVNGNPSGMLIEVCAGLLDGEDPETAIRREAEEETGHRVESVTRIGEYFMSPGSVTERVAFFTGSYRADGVPPCEGSGLCVLYDPDNPPHNATYPIGLVKLAGY